MIEIAQRIRQRIDELGTTQKELAQATGFSTARLGNYVSLSAKHNRTPDVQSLARLAKALRTSTDWLLGISAEAPIDAASVIQRLLELDGMPAARADVIAQAAVRALQLLSALPGDGDAQTRAHLAAQAAWTIRSH
jgi:transcriptional regulator with XRE-family HTH domain